MHAENQTIDINSEEYFFEIIKSSFIKYKDEKNKSVERLLFIVMGLNHLNEWIAPGYAPFTKNGKINVPKTKYEQFSNDVYLNNEHRIVREICSKSKQMESRANTPCYMVDGRDIEEIIEKLILFYQTRWFF